MLDPDLHCIDAADASQWSVIRANMRACEKQVRDIGDEQCFGQCKNSRVCSREEVEGGVGGEGSTAVVQVGEKCVAVVALWAELGRCGLHIEHSILSSTATSTAADNNQHCSKQHDLHLHPQLVVLTAFSR